MTKYLLLALIITFQGFSQATVYLKDGSKILILEESFKVLPKSKRVMFQSANVSTTKLKYKKVDSATVGNFKFKTVKEKRKYSGFYQLAEVSDKKLLAISTVKSRPAGGFERPYKHFEVLITNTSDEVVYRNTFSDDDNSNAEKNRIETLKAIKSNFANCSSVIERLSAIEAVVKNENRVIEEFIKVPVYMLCD